MPMDKLIDGNRITDSDPLQVGGSITAAPTSGPLTDRSGTITTGGTAQDAAAENTDRKYLFIENPDFKEDGSTENDAERMCFRVDGEDATYGAGSSCLAINQFHFFEGGFIPTGAVSVIAATTGHAYTIWEG